MSHFNNKLGKILAVCLLLCISLTAACQRTVTNSKGVKMRLVWSDEFNYKGLPDSSKWDYELGYLRTGEKQFYTKRRENVSVDGKNLSIKALRDNFPNPNFRRENLKNYPAKYRNIQKDSIPQWVTYDYDSVLPYTSGSVITLNKASWTYGKFEVRAQLPTGKGAWPIIWMLGVNKQLIQWPYCGEIDIMEFVGKSPKIFQSNVHYADRQTKKKYSDPKIRELVNPNDFHTYSMEWDATEMRFFVDKVEYHRFQFSSIPEGVENPFTKPFYLLINFALGGSFGGPIDNSIFPQEFKIDYVRVYQ